MTDPNGYHCIVCSEYHPWMKQGAAPENPIKTLRKAIEDKGPCPEFHNEIMRRHRTEWPSLWRAIDALLAQD